MNVSRLYKAIQYCRKNTHIYLHRFRVNIPKFRTPVDMGGIACLLKFAQTGFAACIMSVTVTPNVAYALFSCPRML